ncbi:MAG: hypothetical protein FJ102_16485, partial [Deltaproteobacteria bacterium]|nr:hypothetical protein [Deltaproteobacteria bacterium]
MSAYHYTREAGEQGQVLAAEGTSPGRTLEELLREGRPPLKAALELGAALADILCIAEMDQVVHGDLRPAMVRVATNGDVSLDGFGQPRGRSSAPEGRVDAHAVDIYGLGIVLHSMLADDGIGELPADEEGHDDEVINRVLALDFRAVQGKRWVQDVRTFLCKIMAWHADERPVALDAANVLLSVAAEIPGDGLPEWSVNTGMRAAPGPVEAPAMRPMPSNVEILEGPSALGAPMAKGAVRQAPSSKGESTSFWSREKIAQMLAEEDDDDDAFAAPSPKASPAARSGGYSPAEDLSSPRPLRSTPPAREPNSTLEALPSPVAAPAPPSFSRPATPPPPPSLPRPAEV